MLYAAKCYWPGITRTELEQATARASGARSDGVDYLGALLFSNDDIVVCLYEARSPAAVKQASEQAGIPCERVMDSVWLDPHRNTLNGTKNCSSPEHTQGTDA